MEITLRLLAALAVLFVALVMACATETDPPPALSPDPAGQGADAAATTEPKVKATPTEPPATTATPTNPLGPAVATEPTATATPVPPSPGARQASVKGPNPQTPATSTGIEYHTTKDLVTMVSGSATTAACGPTDPPSAGVKTGTDSPRGPLGRSPRSPHFAGTPAARGPRAESNAGASGMPPQSEQLAESTEVYVSMAAGDSHLCALKENGEVECWTDAYGADDGLDWAPAGEFLMLDAGHSHTCGVQADGSAICWGGEYGEGVAVLPGEKFASVSADHDGYTCGLRTDGSVACWEYRGGEFSHLPAPEGTFESISVAGERGCGVLTGGALRCWSPLPTWALEGLGAPPQGRFTAISVGDEFACASRDDGIVVCWGKTSGAMPPGGYGINELGMVYAVSAVRDDEVTTYIAVGDDNSCQWQEAPQTYHGRFCWGNPDAGRFRARRTHLPWHQRRLSSQLRGDHGKQDPLLGVTASTRTEAGRSPTWTGMRKILPGAISRTSPPDTFIPAD